MGRIGQERGHRTASATTAERDDTDKTKAYTDNTQKVIQTRNKKAIQTKKQKAIRTKTKKAMADVSGVAEHCHSVTARGICHRFLFWEEAVGGKAQSAASSITFAVALLMPGMVRPRGALM